MADITFPARQLFALAEALSSLATLQPPPTPRGRYHLAKISQKVADEIPLYQEQKLDLLKKHAPKDEHGEPLLTVTPLPDGRQNVSINGPNVMAFQKEDAELGTIPITLTGLAQVKHADVGACPIPQGAYNLLLGVIIADELPD